MAGISRGVLQRAFIGTLLVSVMAVGTAVAQSVPVPTPAPRAKEGGSARPGAAPAPAPAPAPQEESGFASGLKSLFNWNRQSEPAAPAAPAATTSAATFTAAQQAQANKVSQYLSNVQQLTGKFVQIGPDGNRVRGEFYIQKPGKVRFEYDPPSPIEIIADGQSVVVRNSKLATQDLFPLSQTPLRFLLSERIDLLRDTNVIGIRSDEVYVTIVIEEKQALIGTSRLMMMVGAKDYQLKQWTVTDPQGYDTTVAVSNLDTNTKQRMDPNLFRIDYTRYNQ